MHPNQQKAIDFVRNYAKNRQASATALLNAICSRSNVAPTTIESILNNIEKTAQIGIHFHPDRLDGTGKTVVDSLLKSGRYQNQFETLVSSGGLTPTADGPRAQWENQLFGDAYQTADLTLRPKYGSLALLPSPYGPSPRFGSCYFLLKPSMLKVSTFTYGDSSDNPLARGTIDCFDDILASLLKESFLSEQVLGRAQLRPPQLMAHLQQNLSSSKHLDNTLIFRNLNQYIEAQIHGSIYLQEHVSTLVVDPSFQRTSIADTLQALCEKYDLSLRWYPRLRLHVDDVPNDYRGGQMSETARKITDDGWIDAEKIGRATITAVARPQDWTDFNARPEGLLKYLWHTLMRFGIEEESPS